MSSSKRRRGELKSVRGISSPSISKSPVTKREELKDIRTSQASLSTNVHLLQRKGVALGELKPKTTRDSRNAIKELESYNEMADRTIKQSNQIRARLINTRNAVREQRHNIVVNKNLYDRDSYDKYMEDYEQYKNDITKSIRGIDALARRIGKNKEMNVSNITTIQDWVAKKGELSRDIQLQRLQKRDLSDRAGGHTVTWTEGDEEKTATFDTPDQVSGFIKRLGQRSEISNIRQTGKPSRVTAKGPLSGLENLTWKYQTFIDLQRSRPSEDGEDTKHPWSRMGKYDTSSPEDMKNALGWAATQTATGAIVSIPFVLAGAVGAVVLGPWGAVFIPAALASFALPKVTTIEQRDKFLKYVEEHPEFYTETAFRILGGLAVAKLGSSGLRRVTDGAVRRVEMSTKNYLKYLRSRPWSGQMATTEQMSWIDQLVSDMLDRVVPKYSHVAGPRTRNVGQDVSFQASKLKDYYWKVPSTGALRGEEVVTVTLNMPKMEHPLWWAVISTPGGYEKIVDSLHDRGLTDIEIDTILVSMGKSQELFVSPILDQLGRLKPLDSEDLRKLSLRDIQNMPILSPDVDNLELLQELIQDQEIIETTTYETISEPTIDLDLPLPLIEPPILRPPLEPKEGEAKKGEKEIKRGLRRPKIEPSELGVRIKIPRYEKPQSFKVRFQYYDSGERIKVKAKSWREAVVLASKRRKIKGRILEIEVEKL